MHDKIGKEEMRRWRYARREETEKKGIKRRLGTGIRKGRQMRR